MTDISYPKAIKSLYPGDTSNLNDLIQSIDKTIDELKFKAKEDRGKNYLLKIRDEIMKIYVN